MLLYESFVFELEDSWVTGLVFSRTLCLYIISAEELQLFNKICQDYKVDVNEEYLKNIEILINLYKKNKEENLINMILFITDYYFYNLKQKKIDNIGKVIEKKSFVVNNINKFLKYNLNQKSLIHAINNKLSNG